MIRGAAEVLAEDPGLDAAQRERVARIERAAEEMAQLIAALLHLGNLAFIDQGGVAACSEDATQIINWVAYLLQCDAALLTQGTRSTKHSPTWQIPGYAIVLVDLILAIGCADAQGCCFVRARWVASWCTCH